MKATKTTKKAQPKKQRYLFLLSVEYPGTDPELDAKILKLVGRKWLMAGTVIEERVRFLSFFFVRKSASMNAAKRVRKIRLKGMRVKVVDR